MDSGVVRGRPGQRPVRFHDRQAHRLGPGPARGRGAACAQALEGFVILGCATNLPFLQAIARPGDFLAGRESTAWIQEQPRRPQRAPPARRPGVAFFRSQPFREALACAFRGMGRPAPGPAERFKAQAAPRELGTGSPQEKPAFRLEPTADPARFILSGPVLRTLLAAAAGAGPPSGAPGSWPPGPRRGARPGPAPSTPAALGGATLAVAVFGETLVLEDPLADLAQPRQPAAAARRRARPHGRQGPGGPRGRGGPVEQGQLMFVLESMKMQFEITAPRAGRVSAVQVAPGQVLQAGETMAELE